ncbi:MAG: hypothetical protein ACTS27_08580 [Phycisphaerales bacterium]
MRTAAALIALAAAASPAAFAGATFDVPFFRGSTASLYAGWESFTTPIGGENLPDDPASNTGAQAFVRQTNPGAIIAGSGNLYSSFSVPNFQVHFNGAGTPVSLLTIQIRTQGLELDWDNVTLNYSGLGSGSIAAERTELFREVQAAPGGAQAFDIISRFDFELSGAIFDSFVLDLPSENPLISLDRVELDIAFIPAPATAAFGALAMAGLTAHRRR